VAPPPRTVSARRRLNWALVAALAILALLAVFRPGQKQAQQAGPLSALQTQSVDNITISRRDQPAIKLRRVNAAWMLVAPLSAPANTAKIEALLALVAMPSQRQLKVPADDLGRFGLEPPRARLSLNEHHFVFGDAQPLDARRYVYYQDTLHLLDDRIYHHLIADTSAYVSTRLVAGNGDLSRIDTPGYSLDLGSTGWVLVQGSRPLTGNQIEAVTNSWATTRAQRVRRLTEDAVVGEVKLGFSDGNQVVFDILSNDAAFMLGRRDWGIVYELTPEDQTALAIFPDPEAG